MYSSEKCLYPNLLKYLSFSLMFKKQYHSYTVIIHTAPGNGGITSTYRWTQTLSDLMIMVPLPAGTKTKALDVVFTNNKLKVRSTENIPIFLYLACEVERILNL